MILSAKTASIARTLVVWVALAPVASPTHLEAATGDCKYLYVSEFTPGHETGDEQHLVRYRFCEGTISACDTILISQTGDVRFDLSSNMIHQNRYLSTNWGDIIDLQERRIMLRGKHVQYRGEERDNIYMVENGGGFGADSTTESIVWRYNLPEGTFNRVTAPSKWLLPGILSPDGSKSVESKFATGVWLHRLDGTSSLLASDLVVELSGLASTVPRPPICWIDDERILTQNGNGKLVILHLDGRLEPLLDVNTEQYRVTNPTLKRDAIGRIVYENYLIDVEKRIATPVSRVPLGSGFEIEYGYGDVDSSLLWHDSVLVGTFFGGGGKAVEGYIVVTECEVARNYGRRPSGLLVWAEDTKIWTRLEVAWIAAVIGWADVPNSEP